MDVEIEYDGGRVTEWSEDHIGGIHRDGRWNFNRTSTGKVYMDAAGMPDIPPDLLVRWLCGEPPPEPPIKVGDTVQWCGEHHTVIATYKDRAWIRSKGNNCTPKINTLTHVPDADA